jgi:NADP-dependent aldehyde dehydrogenase
LPKKNLRLATPFQAGATLFQTDITFLANPDLERSGPDLLINYSKKEQIRSRSRFARLSHRHRSRHRADIVEFSELIAIPVNKVGRIIYKITPRPELCDAIVHGGPYPASADSRTTSKHPGDFSLCPARLLSRFQTSHCPTN